MGRADDKEGEALSSEADDDKDKDYSDKYASDADEPENLDVDSKKKYKCTEPGCTARFLRPSRLTWHLRKHNDERPYKCSIKGCTRAYTNSSHLKRHENTHKPITTTYTCNECLLEVGSLFSLKRHCKMIHDPKRLTCADCGAKFRKKHCYNEHLSMHAGISMYKCEVCQVECPTLRLLKKHQLSHNKKKTYACKAPDCTKVFDKWSLLAKHVETDHQFGMSEKGYEKAKGIIEEWFLDGLWGGSVPDTKNDDCNAKTT
ncbi:zinc finger protein 728-like isoform X2 [Venturia canescens]|uniref:zinc finger protein 728-like isoform X2 n=1 Tax=Venturia canescens TaxID=32260 RepID=UPI001C9CF2F6|nr:zinc finger protein 728-like isoform X2 [Venturia canescens]